MGETFIFEKSILDSLACFAGTSHKKYLNRSLIAVIFRSSALKKADLVKNKSEEREK